VTEVNNTKINLITFFSVEIKVGEVGTKELAKVLSYFAYWLPNCRLSLNLTRLKLFIAFLQV
jgi:hypothetical protein